jgi:UDP-glucose 4-epimerase
MNNLAHVMAISIVGLIGEEKKSMEKIIPYLHKTESGRVAKLEIFSHYVGNFFN